MNLNKLKQFFKSKGCNTIYIKKLSPNDNSKNQVYLAGSFDILNIFPLLKIKSDSSGDWKRDRFKATINYSWITEDLELVQAPKAQLILYPKYPEVRFSGFLQGCKKPPSKLMASRDEGRILFLGVSTLGKILGHVVSAKSELSKEISNLDIQDKFGVFFRLSLSEKGDNRQQLIEEMSRIHDLGWIESKRLDKDSNILPCKSSNCGGYTLEAELGITPNGYSEPDYLGWEVKQFSVPNFEKIYSKVITLMTPEPTGGDYKELGVVNYMNLYGYKDKRGRPDRINFGGIHKADKLHSGTNLTLKLIGFDKENCKIRNTDGKIVLLTDGEKEAASWSFVSLLKHWNKKHSQACYVPSMVKKVPRQEYHYGDKIILGVGTDFSLFLSEMSEGNIYYDPAIKMEQASSDKPKVKRRNQFRIKSRHLPNLYKSNEEVLLEK